MDPRVTRALNVQEFLAQHPAVDSASISTRGDGSVLVKASLSTTSFKTNSKTNHTQSYILAQQDGSPEVIETSMEPVFEGLKTSAEHSAGNWTVFFKEITVKDKKKRIIEIRDTEKGVYEEIDVTDTHAEFLSGEHWGSPAWSDAERLLVYTAEQHAPNWKDDNKPYTAYAYAQSFGEWQPGQVRPGLFILDFSDSNSMAVKPVDAQVQGEDVDSTMFRQPALVPRESKTSDIVIFATGSSLLPDGRRLGSAVSQSNLNHITKAALADCFHQYCWNRPDAIYQITVSVSDQASKPNVKRISSLERSARVPRVIQLPHESSLVYISNRRGYEHASCSTLHKLILPIEPNQLEIDDILVEEVRAPNQPGAFPGLFPDDTPSQSLLVSSNFKKGDNGKSYLVIQTAWTSRATIVLVDLEDGAVHDVGSNEITSYKLLSTDKASKIIAVRSSTVSPPELVLGTVFWSPVPVVKWTVMKSWSHRFQEGKHCHEVTQAIVVSSSPFCNSANLPGQVYEGRLPGLEASRSPESSSLSPFVMDSHGGPNGLECGQWNIGASLVWIAAGYTFVTINYPGSTGFGQDTIEELSKDCGNLDVQAFLKLKDYLIELGIVSGDKGKKLFIGGSHSGFIGAHLSVRWPDAFDAFDLKNPVIDLPSNFATSDIPDWSVAQIGLKYNFDKPPAFVTKDMYLALHEHSPSYYADKLFSENDEPCVAPTQVQVGANDLRVPPGQGKAWYHCLKGHKEDVNLVSFPDNGHSIGQVWAQRSSMTARLDFLVKHSKFD